MNIGKSVAIVLTMAGVLGLASGGMTPAAAQYIGVLQSAETMDVGTFKLMVAPIVSFGKQGADNELGLALRGGYAFTDRFDAEAKIGFFENSTVIGADGEIWLMGNEDRDAGLDVSLSGGIHYMLAKKGRLDTVGLELTPMLSGNLNEDLELCCALDASFEFIQDAPPRIDDSFTVLHLVPGIEYHLSETADLVAEIGIALNDDSSNYAGIGVEFYFR